MVAALAVRVALVMGGEDAASVAALQKQLEVALARPDVIIRSAALPAENAWSSASTRKEVARLQEEGSKAFYEDRQIVALDRFAALSAIQERSSEVPIAARIRVRLWRAMIFLATGDRTAAETEARAALALSPELKVDVTEFRPSLAALVDGLRDRLAPVEVEVRVTPANATLSVDERPVATRFAVVEGRHWVYATAPGHTPLERAIDVNKKSTPIVLELSPATDARVGIAVWGPARANLGDHATALGTDAVVLAATRARPAAECRALIAWPGRAAEQSPVYPDTAEGRAQLAYWTIAQVKGSPVIPATKSERSPVVATTRAPTRRNVWIAGGGAVAAIAIISALALRPAERRTRVLDSGPPGTVITGWEAQQ